MKSPCESCPMANKPDECPDKNCKLWRMWFLYRWEKMRAHTFAEKLHKK